MRIIKNYLSKFSEASDLIAFLWKAKLWFLIPFIIILIAFGLLIIVAQGTGIAPFIYTLF